MIDVLLITMADGRKYTLSPAIVATDRASYYSSKGEDFEGVYQEGINDLVELQDWLLNNMDWTDVEFFVQEYVDHLEEREDRMEEVVIIRSYKNEKTDGFCK